MLDDEERARQFGDLLPMSDGPLLVEVVRELAEEDLRTSSLYETLRPLKALRQAHHQLARLIAKGTPPVEVALITGFELATVYNIQQNEAFAELLAHYRTVETIAEADIRGQMASTGQTALGELSRRLEDAPEDFSIGQLHSTIDLLLVQPNKANGGVSGGTVPALTVNFVGSSTPALKDVIDVTAEEES